MDNMFLLILEMLVWSSLLGILIHLLRIYKWDMKLFGLSGITVIYLIFFIRTIHVIDFNLSSPVFLPGWFNTLYRFMVLNQYTILGFTFTIEYILYFIWIAVACFLILNFLYKYIHTGMWIRSCSISKRPEILSFFKTFPDSSVIVREGDLYPIPISYGVFKKNILIPNRDYADEELENILQHEITHFQNHDLILNFFLQIWKRIFWWNPLYRWICDDWGQLMEMRCDASATKNMTVANKVHYLNAIVSTLHYADDHRNSYEKSSLTMLLPNVSEKIVLERFHTISSGNIQGKIPKIIKLAFTNCLIILVILSYAFMPMPYFEPPMEDILESDESAYEVTPENSYLLHCKDGTYRMISGDYSYELNDTFVEESLEAGFTIKEEE